MQCKKSHEGQRMWCNSTRVWTKPSNQVWKQPHIYKNAVYILYILYDICVYHSSSLFPCFSPPFSLSFLTEMLSLNHLSAFWNRRRYYETYIRYVTLGIICLHSRYFCLYKTRRVNDKQNCGWWVTALGFLPQPHPTWRLMLTLHVCNSPQDWLTGAIWDWALYTHTDWLSKLERVYRNI